MTRHPDSHQTASTARAIDRVLTAERDAEATLSRVRQQAHATLEAAREDARATVNAALERIAAWQHAHLAASERRLAALRAQAAGLARGQGPPDQAAIAAAVARVAARLTGGAPGRER
jgi:vacuolar-type H+-ATPase subunit H